MKKLLTLSVMALLSSFALQATIFGPAGEKYPGTTTGTKRTGLIPNNKNKQGSATGTTSTGGKDAESNIIAPKKGTKYVPGRQY